MDDGQIREQVDQLVQWQAEARAGLELTPSSDLPNTPPVPIPPSPPTP